MPSNPIYNYYIKESTDSDYPDEPSYMGPEASHTFKGLKQETIYDIKVTVADSAGNIGEAQDFDHIMDAALNLKERKDIKFIIVGDGRRKSFVDNFIKEHGLEETVFAPGRFPIEAMPTFFKEADVMLVSLRGDYIFSLTAPAKLQAYMAAGKPVVAMIDGEARTLIAESRCGLSGPAEDSTTLADNILKMKNMTPEELAAMGKSGLEYFQHNFRKDICMNHLCRILEGE